MFLTVSLPFLCKCSQPGTRQLCRYGSFPPKGLQQEGFVWTAGYYHGIVRALKIAFRCDEPGFGNPIPKVPQNSPLLSVQGLVMTELTRLNLSHRPSLTPGEDTSTGQNWVTNPASKMTCWLAFRLFHACLPSLKRHSNS